MNDRWTPFHGPAMRWARRLDRAIQRLGPPRQVCFVSIANAIEVQFEEGADPDTLRHLLRALLRYTAAEGVSPGALKLTDTDPDSIMASLAPKRRSRPR